MGRRSDLGAFETPDHVRKFFRKQRFVREIRDQNVVSPVNRHCETRFPSVHDPSGSSSYHTSGRTRSNRLQFTDNLQTSSLHVRTGRDRSLVLSFSTVQSGACLMYVWYTRRSRLQAHILVLLGLKRGADVSCESCKHHASLLSGQESMIGTMSCRATRSASCRVDTGALFRSERRGRFGCTSIVAGLATLFSPMTMVGVAQVDQSTAGAATPNDVEWSQAWNMRAVAGRVAIRAERVSAWTDVAGVQRVRADSDVTIEVGASAFHAGKASLWIRREGDGASQRLAMYIALEDVGSSTSAPLGGSAVSSDRLLVRSVVDVGDVVVQSTDPVSGRTADAAWSSLESFGEAGLMRSLSRGEESTKGRPFVFHSSESEKATAPLTSSARRFDAGTEPQRRVEILPAVKRDEVAVQQGVSAAPQVEKEPDGTQSQGVASRTQSQVRQQPSADSDSSASSANVENAHEKTAKAASTDVRTKAAPGEVPSVTPLFAKSGRLTFSAGHISIVQGEGMTGGASDNVQPEPMIITSDGLTLLYNDASTGRLLQARAQRGVVFLSPGTGAGGVDFSAEQVLGVYLEGDVTISDGDLNLRAREVYYDIAANRAVMLDATFWFVEQSRNLPLYIRAKEIRQESTRQFKAKDVRFSNTAFINPELSVGVSSATLERRERVAASDEETAGQAGVPGEKTETYSHLVANNVTFRVNDVPFFWWPAYSGDPASPLIRDIRVESRSGSGLAGRIRWNATNLLGLSRIDGLNVDLQTDYYLDRGFALGSRASWETRRHLGGAFVYGLLRDDGEDVLKTGARQRHDGEFRGIAIAEDRFRVNDLWSVLTEGAYISDETFIDAFFEQSGETRREFASRIRAERTEDASQLTFEAKGTFNDFVANEWLLESQGYAVNKLPEAKYTRLADDLLPGVPGLLTHFSEYRASRLSLAFDEIAMQDRGFVNSFQSQRVFGIDPAQSPGDLLRAAGLTENAVTRLDTRHEFVATFDVDNLRVVPFVVGRATLYDNEFHGYSATPDGNDRLRTWASAGVRASTTIERIHDAVDSRLLDIHRLRHIAQPSVTLWTAGTNVEGGDLPVFDSDVESLSDGAAVRLGLSQTLLTKRGDVGQWHDTALLQVNTDFVFSSDDTDPTTPIGRFFDTRPERSALGNYFVGDAAYRLTDATSLTGSMIFDFDSHQPDVTTAGILFQHEPGFSALAETRFLNAQDSSILALVGSFEISDKYSVVVSPNYSMNEGEFQSVYARINRRFSALLAALSINYNNISGETSFGFVIQPYGARGAAGVEGLGSDLPAAYGGGAGGF